MSYAVHLYVEGGSYDGETFLCGPFDTEDEANAAALALGHRGQTTVRPLQTGEAIVAELDSA